MGPMIRKMIFKSKEEPIDQQINDDFFDFKIKDIDGKVIDFKSFKETKDWTP